MGTYMTNIIISIDYMMKIKNYHQLLNFYLFLTQVTAVLRSRSSAMLCTQSRTWRGTMTWLTCFVTTAMNGMRPPKFLSAVMRRESGSQALRNAQVGGKKQIWILHFILLFFHRSIYRDDLSYQDLQMFAFFSSV